jgi:hypothetical protein
MRDGSTPRVGNIVIDPRAASAVEVFADCGGLVGLWRRAEGEMNAGEVQ